MTIREKVMDFINSNFDISLINLEDFPLMPGGIVITDKNGDNMLVWYDIESDRVLYDIKEGLNL